jgi:hypothetical protein
MALLDLQGLDDDWDELTRRSSWSVTGCANRSGLSITMCKRT